MGAAALISSSTMSLALAAILESVAAARSLVAGSDDQTWSRSRWTSASSAPSAIGRRGGAARGRCPRLPAASRGLPFRGVHSAPTTDAVTHGSSSQDQGSVSRRNGVGRRRGAPSEGRRGKGSRASDADAMLQLRQLPRIKDEQRHAIRNAQMRAAHLRPVAPP